MKKKWFEILDFYKLTGLLFLWIASWLFMMPVRIDVNAPYFDNIWGAVFSSIGISKSISANSQQLPDLLSALGALFLMIIMQLRGIFSVTITRKSTENNELSSDKNHRALITILNILSILIHTLFFTMMIKIFLFPDSALENYSVLDKMKNNIGITIFVSCSVTGMVLGVPSLAKLFMILLFAVGVFKNITDVSYNMGVVGFVAILFAVIGFYLEFFNSGFDKEKLLVDLNVLSGHYKDIVLEGKSESKRINNDVRKAGSLISFGSKKSLLKKASLIAEKENVEHNKKKNEEGQ